MGVKLTTADVGYRVYDELDQKFYARVSDSIEKNVALAVKVVERQGIEAFRAAYFRAIDTMSADLSKQTNYDQREAVTDFCVTMHAIFKAVEALTGEFEEDLPYKLDTSHKRFTWPK